SLGSIAGGTVVSNGAALAIVPSSPVAVLEPLTLNGSGSGIAYPGALAAFQNGTNFWLGPITLASDSTIWVQTNAGLALSNVISGPGKLTKSGPGTLVFAGSSANT